MMYPQYARDLEELDKVFKKGKSHNHGLLRFILECKCVIICEYTLPPYIFQAQSLPEIRLQNPLF